MVCQCQFLLPIMDCYSQDVSYSNVFASLMVTPAPVALQSVGFLLAYPIVKISRAPEIHSTTSIAAV